MRNSLGLILILIITANSAFGQCAFDNTYYETVAAPTVSGATVTTLLYGGEYTRVTGMVPGNVYEVTTCGETAFDSQITIYNGDGSELWAFNDDFISCTPQSKIYFSPFTVDDYSILLDQFNCSDNFVDYMTVSIRLFDTPDPIITIPVVVHIVYNGSGQNISDAQVQSQIDVLNKDFRRFNPDVANSPSRHRGFSKDSRIEFCLASRDPNGQSTNGITRTSTAHAPFLNDGNNHIKFNTYGGKDIWNRDKYLNLWVCALEGTLLGWANFPGTGTASIDGVVVNYEAFGTIGTANAPSNLGRTTTHEIGHWLDLYHVFQDGCTGLGDDCNDTPFQENEHYGCPSNPTSCGNSGYGGDMYSNFMDYVDDGCMNMFTFIQNLRMRAALDGPRSSIKTSNGCQSVTGINELSHLDGLVSVYPNPSSGNSVYVEIQLNTSELQNSKFVVYNVLGKEMSSIENYDNEFQLDIQGFKPGVYFYQLSLQNGESIGGKIIIN